MRLAIHFGRPAGVTWYRASKVSTPLPHVMSPVFALIIAATLGLGCCAGQSGSTSAYTPVGLEINGAAYPAWLNVFPLVGKELRVPLRPRLVGGFYSLATSPNGRAIYGLSSGEGYEGLKKLEFNPVRLSTVPASAGLVQITSLTASPVSGKLFVSATTRVSGKAECGDFEIDPSTGTNRLLRLGTRPDCGGPVSPDGRFELHRAADQLSLLDLTTGARTPIGTGMRYLPLGSQWAAWSPDNRWIAAVFSQSGTNTLTVIDVRNPEKIRSLGTADGPLVWSPDSRYLLIENSQVSCWATLYGMSLQIVDVGTGKRTLVKNSHCRIAAGTFLWLDADASH